MTRTPEENAGLLLANSGRLSPLGEPWVLEADQHDGVPAFEVGDRISITGKLGTVPIGLRLVVADLGMSEQRAVYVLEPER